MAVPKESTLLSIYNVLSNFLPLKLHRYIPHGAFHPYKLQHGKNLCSTHLPRFLERDAGRQDECLHTPKPTIPVNC